MILQTLFLCVLGATLALRSESAARPLNYVADLPQQDESVRREWPTEKADGPLRHKAAQHDAWNAKHHHPFYGGQTGVLFRDAQYSHVQLYHSYGDSCLWTGTYMGSQAMRYHVTKEPDAKANLIKSAKALDGYLHVTNSTGYIARYYAPQNPLVYPGDEVCKKDPGCHKVTTGKYAGDFWQGDTTKDQYTGWFYGMALGYEFVDDPDTKKMIRDDVVEVVDKLIQNGWIILDEKGAYHVISAGQRPTYVYQLSWLLIAYHLTGSAKYKAEIEKRLHWYDFWWEEINSMTGWFNRYNQFYGNNLAHTTWYNLLRLGKIYLSHDAHQRLKDVFSNGVHARNKLEHNAWFNAIFMSQGNYKPTPQNDQHLAQLIEDLTDVRGAPNYAYYLPARNASTYQLDPATSWVTYFPELMALLSQVKLNFRPQALHAFPVRLQCYSDFIFQRSPYVISACGGDNKLNVQPGADYLAPYWLSVFHGFISPNQ